MSKCTKNVQKYINYATFFFIIIERKLTSLNAEEDLILRLLYNIDYIPVVESVSGEND